MNLSNNHSYSFQFTLGRDVEVSVAVGRTNDDIFASILGYPLATKISRGSPQLHLLPVAISPPRHLDLSLLFLNRGHHLTGAPLIGTLPFSAVLCHIPYLFTWYPWRCDRDVKEAASLL